MVRLQLRVGRRIRWRLVLPVLLVAALLPGSATRSVLSPALRLAANAGDLDVTFDQDGIAIDEISSNAGFTSGTVIQPLPGSADGFAVLVLTFGGEVYRFRPDGSLDVSFGPGGVISVDTSPRVVADHIAVLGDGSFIVGGRLTPGGPAGARVGFARFTATGTLDTSFGTNGVFAVVNETPPPAATSGTFVAFSDNGTADLALQSDGSAVLSGEGTRTTCQPEIGCLSSPAIVAARVNPAGTARTMASFVPAGTGLQVRGLDVAVDAADRVVVSGDQRAGAGPNSVFTVRFLADLSGTDPAFTVSPVQADTGGLPLAIRGSDGTIAVIASTLIGTTWTLVRWNSSGTVLGSTATNFGQGATNSDLAVSTGGSFVGVGVAGPDPDPIFLLALASWDANGANPQNSTTRVPALGGASLPDAATLPGGGFMLAFGDPGDQLKPDGILRNQLWLTRLTSAGAIDTTFGPAPGGYVGLNTGGEDSAAAVAVRPDGRIVAAGGIATTDARSSGFVLRHLVDGPLDTTLNPPAQPPEVGSVPGIKVTAFGEGNPLPVNIQPSAVTPDGDRMVIAGIAATDAGSDMGAIDRLQADGEPDPSFNGGEPFTLSQGTDSTTFRDVAVDSRGRIVAVGEAVDDPLTCGSPTHAVIVRLLADGTPDNSFDTDGILVLDPGLDTRAAALAIDDAGRVVLTGSAQGAAAQCSNTPSRLLVARLRDNGAPDPSFDGDGIALGPAAVAGAGVIARGARIVVAGTELTVVGTDPPVSFPTATVVQFTGAGAPDNAFGQNGRVDPFPHAELSAATGIALDAIGNAVVVGGSVAQTVNGFQPGDILLGRLLPDGRPDPSFGTNGVVVTDTGAGEIATAVAIAPDEKIVVAGALTDARSTRVLLARYEPGARLDCQPATVDFGSVLVGDTASGTVTCTNLGPGRLAITSTGLTGGNVGDFTATPIRCVNPLPPKRSCQFTVSFTPTAVGLRTTTLRVEHTGADGVELVNLRGVGLARVATFSARPATVDFGEVLARSTTPARTVTVTNLGNTPLVINTLTIVGAQAGDFTITASTCGGASLAPSATCVVSVRFRPSHNLPAQRLASLRFVDTASGSPHAVGLRGTVTQPKILVNPAVLKGGQVATIMGSGFPAGQPVPITFGAPFIEGATAVPAGDGSFRVDLLVFPGSPGGPRILTARSPEPAAPADPARVIQATSPVLVTPGSAQPPDFTSRH